MFCASVEVMRISEGVVAVRASGGCSLIPEKVVDKFIGCCNGLLVKISIDLSIWLDSKLMCRC